MARDPAAPGLWSMRRNHEGSVGTLRRISSLRWLMFFLEKGHIFFIPLPPGGFISGKVGEPILHYWNIATKCPFIKLFFM